MFNNTFYGDTEKFIQLRDNYGNITINFTQKRLTDWRNTFSLLRYWGVGASFDIEKRRQFTKLNPPFILEDEGLIFDTAIGKGYSIASLINIRYKNIFLKSGYVLATESRLIFGNIQENIVNQVLYKDIRGVYYEKSKDPTTVTLTLSDNAEITMLLKLSQGSVLWDVFAVAVGTVSPTAGDNWNRGEMNKIAAARAFLDNFIEFFNEIADENRRRRKGQ
jgi:hypothetical protein